ncbi:MAG TPA: DivIVA domain-containing protein [Ilumatobacteraceae bacterium]|nr:DivIVA domain-containing protein [Ilumatobacteraceae bacterium]
MALSPQRIRDTQFKSVRKGFDPTEVEAFVEEVAAALETAQNEATAMEARARAAVARLQELSQQSGDAGSATEGAPAEPAARVDEAETISRTLLLAQRTADTTVAEAQAEADRLLATARDDAARSLDAARAEVEAMLEGARSDARRAGESERVQVEGEVQALLARRDFLESDVDHLEQYLVAQRERIVEAVASLNDLVQRVPGGLGDMRRPLLSAAADPVPAEPAPAGGGDVGSDDIVDGEIVDDPIDEPSLDGPADAGPDDQDEIAEITRVATADEPARDATPPSGSLFDEGGEPTQQMSAVDPRDPARG